MSTKITPPTSPSAEARENYTSLDGLRAYAAVGIVMMHVLVNIPVKPRENILTERVIPWFTDFTLLFMIISAFSMCCGYYDRVKTSEITPSIFYAKRYRRTWPFFALMVMVAFMMEPSWATFCQSFANLTMCFNLLPNPDIKVIGVGWFLGTVFTFYMLFPFFTFLLDNKRRGWLVLTLSIVFCYMATTYFSAPSMVVGPIGRQNIIYSAPFFISGGMIYLYRHTIKQWVERYWITVMLACVALTILKFTVTLERWQILSNLVVFSAWLMYALGAKDRVLNNRVVKYLSGISMEIYLCHMMFFRVTGMLHIDRLVHQPDVLYALTLLMTMAGAICFSHIMKYYILNNNKLFLLWQKKN